MKIGKVFAKLAQDKKVKGISHNDDGALVTLNEGFALEGKTFLLCCNAKEANAFVRGSKKVVIETPVEQPAMKTVRSLMTGKEIEIAADTPLCLDPSSETYWCM